MNGLEFVSVYMGESEEVFRGVFFVAVKVVSSVVLFDEFDVIVFVCN